MTIDEELQGLLDPNLTTDKMLDNIEKALKDRDAIIQSLTATDEEKAKAADEKARIEGILIGASRMQQANLAKKRQAKLTEAKKKAEKAKRKAIAKARAVNRKKRK